MRQRIRTLTLAVVVAALCSAFLDGNCSNNPTPVPEPTPTPSPSPVLVSKDCDPVRTVGVSVQNHPNPLIVGVTYELDATPKDADGAKVEPPSCHGSVVEWTLGGTAPCKLLGNTNGFNPGLSCSAPGEVTAQACVSSPGGCGLVTLPVRA
jgi:hypothetical protein